MLISRGVETVSKQTLYCQEMASLHNRASEQRARNQQQRKLKNNQL